MNLPAFVVISVVKEGKKKKVRIDDVMYVDNKKRTKKTHAEKLKLIQHGLIKLIERNGLMVSDDDELDDIINDVHVVREKGFSRFATTTQTLFKVVGVSDLTILDLMGVKNVEEITPTSVKKYTTGDGKATKLDVMDAVRNYLISEQKDFEFYSDDVSDAVAVGISYAIKNGLLI